MTSPFPVHTELPWQIGSKSGFPVILGASYEVATPSFCGVNYGTLKSDAAKTEEILANAAFIVRAVNSHYQLLEALKAVMSEAKDANANGDVLILSHVVDLVQQAIAAAEARS